MSERPHDLRLLGPALAAWGSGAALLGVPARWRLVLAGSLLLAAGGGLARWWRRRGRRRVGRHAVLAPGGAAAAAVLTGVACAAVLAASGAQTLVREAGPLTGLAEQRAAVEVRGDVVSDPREVPGRGGIVLLRLTVREVDGRGERSLVRARVMVFADRSWLGVHWGERVAVRGRLAPARPGDDVVATVDARGSPTVLARATALDRLAERVRLGLRRAAQPLPADPRGLLPGLVVGDTSLQPAALGEAMRVTGLTHLAAVSGTNTTLVCGLALVVGRAVGLGRRLRLVGAGAVLAGFVVLARPEPSVLRAAVMGALGLLALGTARRRAAVPALSAAVVVLLVVDPWLARSYGFALSVLATLGLLLLAAPLADRLGRRLPRLVALGLAVPVSAQVACAPVIVLLSGQVSLVAVPANLLAEPLVAPATVLGLAAALTSLVSSAGAGALAWAACVPCLGIATVARSLARVPSAQVPWPGGVAGAVWLAVLLLAALALGPFVLRWAAGHRPPAAAATALLLAVAAPLPSGTAWPPPGWVLVACDVGQGDALVLSTAPGHGVLVDAGPDPSAVDGCLRRLGVRTLDVVVLTHFHADHVDGLSGALAGRRVGLVLVTLVDDPLAQARRVRAELAAAHLAVRTVVDGERVEDGPVSWQVLWPGRVIHEGSVPNNASIVLDVRTRGLRLLLLGDVEPAAARAVDARLRALPDGARADVLKVAHHGSSLQDPRLVTDVHARLAVISVGAGNDYGHPALATLRLLQGTGARVARTDRSGDVAVVALRGGPALVTSGPRSGAVRARR